MFFKKIEFSINLTGSDVPVSPFFTDQAALCDPYQLIYSGGRRKKRIVYGGEWKGRSRTIHGRQTNIVSSFAYRFAWRLSPTYKFPSADDRQVDETLSPAPFSTSSQPRN